MYHKEGKYADAANIEEVIKISSRIFGNDHPRTIDIMVQHALTYYAQGRMVDAERILKEAEGSTGRGAPRHTRDNGQPTIYS
jgi:hypothetical protein